MFWSDTRHGELVDFRTGVLFCSQQARVEKAARHAQDRTPIPNPAPQPRRGPALPADASASVAAASRWPAKPASLTSSATSAASSTTRSTWSGRTPSWCCRRAWPITRRRCWPNCSTPTGGSWTVGTNRRRSIWSRTGRTSPDIAIGRAASTATRPTRRWRSPRRLRTRSVNVARSVPPTWSTRAPSTGGGACRRGWAGRRWRSSTAWARLASITGSNTRRYFDLIERLLPADLLAARRPQPDRRGVRGLARRAPRRIARSRQPGRGRVLVGHGRDEG